MSQEPTSRPRSRPRPTPSPTSTSRPNTTLQPVQPQYKEPLPLSADFFNNTNGLVFSVYSDWFVGNRVMNGIRPPEPSVIYSNDINNNYYLYPEPTVNNYNLIKINSLREPFAVEHLVTQYGTETVPRLGTAMGTR